MEVRSLGRMGPVSALTLGGGGIGRVWGHVDRDEAIATVHAAVDAGITLLDLAPVYGPDDQPEAETLVGEAFGHRIPEQVRVTSKLPFDDSVAPEAIPAAIRSTLRDTLARLGREHLDVLFVHSPIRPAGVEGVPGTFGVAIAREVVIPELERLVAEGVIGGWGLTGTMHPDPLCELLADTAPTAVQCVVNPLDEIGDLWPAGMPPAPGNARVHAAAVASGASVMAIRALAAGALADGFDRVVPDDHPAADHFRRAADFRALARERGESPALLAHRYALSRPDVATVVLGVKNREELAECLAAEAAPRLSDEELHEIERACAQEDGHGPA